MRLIAIASASNLDFRYDVLTACVLSACNEGNQKTRDVVCDNLPIRGKFMKELLVAIFTLGMFVSVNAGVANAASVDQSSCDRDVQAMVRELMGGANGQVQAADADVPEMVRELMEGPKTSAAACTCMTLVQCINCGTNWCGSFGGYCEASSCGYNAYCN